MTKLTFAGATSILNWAGKNSVLQYIDRTRGLEFAMPYICKDNTYYYFAARPTCYELVMISSLDLNGE